MLNWDVKINPLDDKGNYSVTANVTDDIDNTTRQVNILSCRLDDEVQKKHCWYTLQTMYDEQVGKEKVKVEKRNALQAEAADCLNKKVEVIKNG